MDVLDFGAVVLGMEVVDEVDWDVVTWRTLRVPNWRLSGQCHNLCHG